MLGAAAAAGDVGVGRLTRDPVATAGGPWYLGLLSHVGVMLWSAAAAIAWHASGGLAADPSTGPGARGLLRAVAALSALLALDDALMFHDRLLPDLGIRERYVVGTYGLLTLAIAARWWRVVPRQTVPSLTVAFAWFAASLVSDKLDRSEGSLHYLLEDGAKFVGIVCWLAWNADLARLLAGGNRVE